MVLSVFAAVNGDMLLEGCAGCFVSLAGTFRILMNRRKIVGSRLQFQGDNSLPVNP